MRTNVEKRHFFAIFVAEMSLTKRKMKTFILSTGLLLTSVGASAQELPVTLFRHMGPMALHVHALLDNAYGKHFEEAELLKTPLRMERAREGKLFSLPILPKDGEAALHLLFFSFTNTSYAKANIQVEGLKHHELYVDGQVTPNGQEVELQPATHEVIIKALTTATSTDSVRVTLKPSAAGQIVLDDLNGNTRKRLYTMDDVLHARRYGGLSLSPDGRWLTVRTSQTKPGGATQSRTEVREVATGRCIDHRDGITWMPRTARYYFTDNSTGRRELRCIDPVTQAETLLASDLPEGYFSMTPTEDRLVFTLQDEGPKERPDVYEVMHPDDRQPGWRTRSRLAVYDLRTGLMQPLTFGHSSIYLNDLSQDGRYALISAMSSQLGARPTEGVSVFRIDMQTMAVDTLVSREGFLNNACFSPDGRQVLLQGSPEALGGIGKNVREGQTPNMTEGELFLMDIDSGKANALTRNFNPSVGAVEWSTADGQIYFTAEDKDFIRLFCLNPKTGDIRRIDIPEEVVLRFSLASHAPVLAFCGQGASNSDRLYSIDLKKESKEGKKKGHAAVRLLEYLSAETLKNVELGSCEPYTFVNPTGDSICCRYYLPPHFDASKRYPMIVNYYGGCSPTSRHFETRYPQHAYAALGYVVLVVNPRGATGFGQPWAAHHVNTAGDGVAEDIIGAVKAFCADHQWVNDKKIGCIGASYGGFMTQYLQTKTDLFAAAISHAGISDHTSYWGEGYWGYTYSEVSMANSYPWTRKDLYVDQSPLFNADKIHTPLLFVHGDADHNVPVGESIQMYTALKLLGRPTAMVLVKDQDHHIIDYTKRLRWQQTIWAWFARWLQDDPTWWQSMYPDKDL